MTPFIRTVRSLDSDHPTPQIVGVLFAIVLLGAWVAWFGLAHVSVYETSTNASLQAEHEAHPVDAAVSGRVTKVTMVAGREVEAGEVLVELDASAETLEVATEKRRQRALREMIEALHAQIDASRRSWAASREVQTSLIAEAQSRRHEAESSAVFAENQLQRVNRLSSLGFVTQEELDRTKNVADQSRASLTVARLTVERLTAEQRAQFEDRDAALRGLTSRSAELGAQIDVSQNRVERLAQDAALRRIVAPITGRLGEIAVLQPGSFVHDGQRLTTVVPAGPVRIVSFFPANLAMGRLRAGQRGQLQLTALPWPQYRLLPARVLRVSAAPAQGTFRVELSVDSAEQRGLRLEHGMTGRVEVEVDRVSPAALLFRKIGFSQRLLDSQ